MLFDCLVTLSRARGESSEGTGPVSPITRDNDLLETSRPLTSEQKARFAYFGVNAKVLPPLRILNPQNVTIGDYTAIREGCHLNAFRSLAFLRDYIAAEHRDAFKPEDYEYDGQIIIEREC